MLMILFYGNLVGNNLINGGVNMKIFLKRMLFFTIATLLGILLLKHIATYSYIYGMIVGIIMAEIFEEE